MPNRNDKMHMHVRAAIFPFLEVLGSVFTITASFIIHNQEKCILVLALKQLFDNAGIADVALQRTPCKPTKMVFWPKRTTNGPAYSLASQRRAIARQT